MWMLTFYSMIASGLMWACQNLYKYMQNQGHPGRQAIFGTLSSKFRSRLVYMWRLGPYLCSQVEPQCIYTEGCLSDQLALWYCCLTHCLTWRFQKRLPLSGTTTYLIDLYLLSKSQNLIIFVYCSYCIITLNFKTWSDYYTTRQIMTQVISHWKKEIK